MSESTMNKENFVTCDLLDANPESQVCLPNIEGKSFYSFGGKDRFLILSVFNLMLRLFFNLSHR